MRPSAARNGRQATSEYILYDANAGYQQTLLPVVTRPAKKTGLRSHRHHQHRRTGGSEPMERHETPDAVRSSAVKPGSSASAFGLRPALTLAPTALSSRRPGSVPVAPASPRLLGQFAGGACVRSRVRARAYSRVRTGAGPGGNTRQRSGKTPQTAKKPGLGAGPGHPEPRRERRDISRPFSNDHAG